ncbi:MAG: hypothetical protein IT323_18090 [Anaerolineae bacterium]|nr:hypothetical protein [Anaerolineae bacterium]
MIMGYMSTQILATKLHIPSPRRRGVSRPRLVERLNEGLHHRLSLIAAPAGFGKTTLLSEWVAGCKRPVAWLSLDRADNDPNRFLAYLVAALQTVGPDIGPHAPRSLFGVGRGGRGEGRTSKINTTRSWKTRCG